MTSPCRIHWKVTSTDAPLREGGNTDLVKSRKRLEKSAADLQPKGTEVCYPLNGWKYVIEERGGEFWAFRVGIHENVYKAPRPIAVSLTFEEAKREAEKAHRRSEAQCWY